MVTTETQAETPSLFDELAGLVPEERQAEHYRVIAHTRTLTPNDEMLRILEAMGVLALLTRETPAAKVLGLFSTHNSEIRMPRLHKSLKLLSSEMLRWAVLPRANDDVLPPDRTVELHFSLQVAEAKISGR